VAIGAPPPSRCDRASHTLVAHRDAVQPRAGHLRPELDAPITRLQRPHASQRVIDEEEAVEILEARGALEGVAARYAAQRAGPQDVDALRAIVVQMTELLAAGDLLGKSELNARLHGRIVDIANLPMVASLIDDLNAQNVRHQFRTVLAPGRPSQSLREHGAIVDAIASGNATDAEEAMRTHISNVIRTLQLLGQSRRP